MVLVQNYSLAVFLCFVAMVCWGSWQNTQNLIGKSWRFELFYWDYSIGILLFALLMAFTFGSFGNQGRSFIPDLAQADPKEPSFGRYRWLHLEYWNSAACCVYFNCRNVGSISDWRRNRMDPGNTN